MSSIINRSQLEEVHKRRYQHLIQEYQKVKSKEHKVFNTLTEFYEANGIDRKNFHKYYNRYKQSNKDPNTLLPQKRGPKYKTRRPSLFIEEKVLEERRKGTNKYEIHSILKPELKERTPSPSGIYNICKRYNLNRLNKQMKEEKRKIITKRAGELGHIDCHYLDKDILPGSRRKYLVCVIDGCTRIGWAEVVEDIQSLTVMFSVLRSFNYINDRYNIKFERVLTDNGAEFGSGKDKRENPFHRLLMEMGIKHTHTRPYRPQTNGKIERFWKTLKEDMLEGAEYDTVEQLEDELLNYMVYYNEHRPHQGLSGKTPDSFRKLLPN